MFGRRTKKVDESALESAPMEYSQGSRDAFRILYEKYSVKVYRFCFKLLGDEAAAKDAFQETFARVYEYYDKFDGQNFNAWLFKIARNNCLNQFRAKKDHEHYDEFIHTANSNYRESDFGLKEYIDEAIAKLPVKYREAIVLREYEECSYQEISDILGIEISLAKIRVFRGRNLLRQYLEPIVKELNEIK